MYDAMDVAEYTLWYSNIILKSPITNLKLQKLLYYIQGSNIVLNKSPLFDNCIEAWKYGPVVPDVYYWYSDNLGNNITEVTDSSVEFRLEEVRVMRAVIKKLINENVWKIVRETHRQIPWINHACFSEEIPIEEIEEYFSSNWEEVWSIYQ